MADDFWNPFAGNRWTPEKVGDVITGKILERRVEESGFGRGDYPVLVLQVDAEGTQTEVHCSSMLASALARHAPAVGDWVKITLTELRHTGKPSPLKVYEVSTKPGTGEPELAPVEPVAVETDDLGDYDGSPF